MAIVITLIVTIPVSIAWVYILDNYDKNYNHEDDDFLKPIK